MISALQVSKYRTWARLSRQQSLDVRCPQTVRCRSCLIRLPWASPPANLSPGTVLMTLQANCTCPFPLPQALGKPETTLYYARADSFSPQDQFSGIPTPVIAWNPKYGCQVLQHVTTPIQQVILCPVLHTNLRGSARICCGVLVITEGIPSGMYHVHDMCLAGLGVK